VKGEDVSDWHFNNEITEPHDGFKKWIGENQERINIANETESGTRIMMKKLIGMGLTEKDARSILRNFLK